MPNSLLLQDILCSANNYLQIREPDVPIPCTPGIGFEPGTGRVRDTQPAGCSSASQGHTGHPHVENTKSEEKLPSTVAVATSIQGQGKCNIIGLPFPALSLPRARNYQSGCSQADELKYCRQFFLLSWKQLLSGLFLFQPCH